MTALVKAEALAQWWSNAHPTFPTGIKHMTKPMGTRDLIDAIAKIDDRLIDLQSEAEARSYGAISGDQADIAALEENRHQRQELEARRTILEQAKAQAARNEAADQETAAAERVKQTERSIR